MAITANVRSASAYSNKVERVLVSDWKLADGARWVPFDAPLYQKTNQQKHNTDFDLHFLNTPNPTLKDRSFPLKATIYVEHDAGPSERIEKPGNAVCAAGGQGMWPANEG